MTPIRFNDLEIRLAETPAEIDSAQALRYRVFFEEMGAIPDETALRTRRDVDPFDAYCDHLIAIDRRSHDVTRVVGTYRLLRGTAARRGSGFYSAGEFDLTTLTAYPGEILELGRSCVDPAYRRGQTMLMLWRGIAAYIAAHDIDILFGCGSLPGTDPASLARSLSYLHHFHLAPVEVRPRSLAHRTVDMRLLPRHVIEPDAALNALPPLLKGYIRLGGWVGEGAVIDRSFNTVDVCIVVETERLTAKYARHYIETPGREAHR